MEAAAQVVVKDCDHFDLPVPSFEVLDSVTKEIRDQKASWALYGDWAEALDQFTKVHINLSLSFIYELTIYIYI